MRYRVWVGNVGGTLHDRHYDAADCDREYSHPERDGGGERKNVDGQYCLGWIRSIGRWQQAHENRKAYRNHCSDQQDLRQPTQNCLFEPGWFATIVQSLEVFHAGLNPMIEPISIQHLSTENNAPAHDGFQDDRLANFLCFDAGQVAVDQYHIGKHPRLQRAFAMLLK